MTSKAIKPIYLEWINQESQHYYKLIIQQDLIGDWVLIKIRGSIGEKKQQRFTQQVLAPTDCIEKIVKQVSAQNKKRGFMMMNEAWR